MAGRADVVRIAVGTSWGTGFAIAPDRVLTALHVVGKVVDGDLRLHGSEIRIVAAAAADIGGGGSRFPVAICNREDIIDHDAKLDLAVISVDVEAFAGIRLPLLGAVAASDQAASWSTYGFPDPSTDLGKATGGDVRSIDALIRLGSTVHSAIQLYSDEAGAEMGGAVHGYSGGPVIVDDQVIGVICAASADASGKSVEGTLYAIPLTSIDQRLGLVLRRDRSAAGTGAASLAAPGPARDPEMVNAATAPAAPGATMTPHAMAPPTIPTAPPPSAVPTVPPQVEPVFPVTSAISGAVATACLGALLGSLIAFDVPAWGWSPVLVIGVLSCIGFVRRIAARDPVAGVRRSIARLLVLVGLLAVLAAVAGLAAGIAERFDAAVPLGAPIRAVLGGPWQFELGLLVVGLSAEAFALPLLAGVPQAPAASTAATAHAGVIDPATGPPLPEVFHDRIRMLFEKRAFEAFKLDRYDRAAGCLVGECRDASGSRRAVVRCDDRSAVIGEADVAAVARYAAGLPGGDRVRAYYVTPAAAALAPGLAARFRDVTFVGEADLLDSLVYFDGYLKRVIEIYEKDPLPYSHAAVKSLADTFVAPRFAFHGSTGQPPRVALRDYLDDWLADHRPRQIALLADYGMGKSSFLRHYAWHLACARLAGGSGRIPILLSLTGRSPRNQPGADGLLQAFINQYQLRCEVDAFHVLMKAGRLVFLIDAFDEMDLVGDRAMRLDHFAELWRLYTAGNKLLFAGRPTFFPDEAELNAAFRIANRGPERLTGNVYCERLALSPLTDDDIARSFDCYFEPATARWHYDWVRGNPRLLDLARRPAMMHIIRDTIDELRSEQSDAVTLREASLLKIYTDHWIVREEGGKQRKLLVSRDLRALFSENLAAWMFEIGRRTVQSRELSELFTRWFPDEAARVASGAGAAVHPASHPQTHLLEGIETDLRNCTFLVRDPDGSYTFAHKPFFEYFVAASIERCLHDGRELPAVFQGTSWGTESALHVADLWLLRRGGPISEREAQRVFSAIMQFGPRTVLRIALQAWLAAIGLGRRQQTAPSEASEAPLRRPHRRRRRLRLRLRLRHWWFEVEVNKEFVAAMKPTQLNALQVLLRAGVRFAWIDETLFHRTILDRLFMVSDLEPARCLPMLELTGARFDAAMLKQVDLSGRSLRGTSFEGALLTDCWFDRADLTDARLTGARLQDVSLVGAILHRARLDKTTIVRCRFDRASADDARFDEASFLKGFSSMRFMSLRRASLRDAALQADLTGASWVGANISGAAVIGPRFAFDRAPAGLPAPLPSVVVPPVDLAPVTLDAHASLVWSPDDACILTLSRGSAWIIDASDGALIRRLQDPMSPVIAAAFQSPDSIVVATATGTIVIHDLVSGERHARSLGFEPVMVAFGRFGTMFVAVAGRGPDRHGHRLCIGPCDHPERSSWVTADGEVSSVALGTDLQTGIFGEVVVAALTTPSNAAGLEGTEARPGDPTAATTSGTRSVWILNGKPGPSGELGDLRAEAVAFHEWVSSNACVLVKPDGSSIAVVDGDRAWSCDRLVTRSRKRARRWLAVDHAGYRRFDGTWFLTQDRDWAAGLPATLSERLWAISIGDPTYPVHDFGGREIAVSGPGVIAIVDHDSGLYRAFKLGDRYRSIVQSSEPVLSDLRFVDGDHLATGGMGTVRLWDLCATCEAASQSSMDANRPLVLLPDGRAVCGTRLVGESESEQGNSWGTTFCAGRQHAAVRVTGEGHDEVRIVPVSELHVTSPLVQFDVFGRVGCSAFDPDDHWFALAVDRISWVSVVALHSQIRLAFMVEATALAFFEGALMTGDAAGVLRRCSLGDSPVVAAEIHPRFTAPITALTACGPQLAIATADRRIYTWAPGDEAAAPLAGPFAVCSRLACSLDGRWLAAACDDDIVRLFDLPTRSLAARLYHLEAGWAAVRADGKYDYGGDVSRLATAHQMRAYRLSDLDELIPDGRIRRGRSGDVPGGDVVQAR